MFDFLLFFFKFYLRLDLSHWHAKRVWDFLISIPILPELTCRLYRTFIANHINTVHLQGDIFWRQSTSGVYQLRRVWSCWPLVMSMMRANSLPLKTYSPEQRWDIDLCEALKPFRFSVIFWVILESWNVRAGKDSRGPRKVLHKIGYAAELTGEAFEKSEIPGSHPRPATQTCYIRIFRGIRHFSVRCSVR